VVPLILRKMRTPILVLLSSYAIAILGFTLIPGVDDQGNPWRMDFFHAFYVVSYTGSTIGFGEVPYAFTNAQRAWTILSIYLTVISWLYAIGTLISQFRDPAFQAALHALRISRSVRHITEPFRLICGYGDTGSLMVRAFSERGCPMVVVEWNPERINALAIRDLPVQVPALELNAGIPANLINAGLRSEWCEALVAVTDDDHTNLQAAIISKLLNPGLTVICRAETAEAEANMASFGTDHIINPHHHFAERLVMAMGTPDMHLVFDWLSGVPHTKLQERPRPPRGIWIICGYGRLGRAVHRELRAIGLETVIIEQDPDARGCPPNSISGKGTEAKTLEEAGIHEAAAVLAGTSDDADNLSIIMTARAMRPDIFLVARENQLANKPLFQAADPEIVFEASYIITTQALAILNAPLLKEFLQRAGEQSQQWHGELVERIREVADGMVPESWTEVMDREKSPALIQALELGEKIPLGTILRSSRNREEQVSCLPLLLCRDAAITLLPDKDMLLESGDRVLFCGTLHAMNRMRGNLRNLNSLRYAHTGKAGPDGLLWRALARRRAP